MRFFRRSLLGLMLVALTIGLLAAAGQTIRAAIDTALSDGRPGAPARERVFTANVIRAEATQITPQMAAFGEIRSRRTLELRAPRAGTVIELAEGFSDGAFVQAGQLLLRLDPTDALANRDLARADQQQAEADLRDAERGLSLARDDLAAAQAQAGLRAQALDRQNGLMERGVGSAAAVETAALAASSAEQAVVSRRSALAAAEARVDKAGNDLARQAISLAEAERALRETELFAQFDGVLNDVSTVTGRILTSNERLGELIDPDALEVAFRLSTAQFSRLIDRDGALLPARLRVALEVSGAELMTEGRLERAGASVGEGQSGRLVFASLAAAGGFRPGDFVTVQIDEPVLENVVALPSSALDGSNQVLILGEDDRLEVVQARLLRRQGDLVILAADGIVGRDVVRERSPLLGAGIKVKPVRPAVEGAETPQAPDMIALTPERRAKLVAMVEGNNRMPAEAKARILSQLANEEVPVRVVERLESRMGG
jgi:multidrug efflux pump subunit AcrA (membrane-fusion protein)